MTGFTCTNTFKRNQLVVNTGSERFKLSDVQNGLVMLNLFETQQIKKRKGKYLLKGNFIYKYFQL